MVLCWLFVLAAVVQCIYGIYFFSRVFSVPRDMSASLPDRRPLSVIICAKNEAENLKKCLPAILSQKYTDMAGKALYEVIVVNDGSTDNTMEVLKELEQRYDHLWDVTIPPEEDRQLKGKKFALSRGLIYSSHEWLLLIDADCVPASDRWLEQMIAPLAFGKEIVAGYGGYHRSGGLLNAFTRWETLHTFVQYSTYALAGKPYMAVGRNMACTKTILLRAQQSDVWNALPSGDDDLLVSIAGNKNNVAVVCSPEAFTWSAAKTNWKDWIKQKQRHLSTGKYYKSEAKWLLGIYAASHTILWICFFILLFQGMWLPAVACMAVRCLLYWVLWYAGTVKVEERGLIYLFPIFDFAWMIYNFAFLPYITWKNKKQWT
jgi:glycosyltransferase involved in cell wall biosynthesis